MGNNVLGAMACMAAFVAACGGSVTLVEPGGCVPGSTEACHGPGQCSGAQVCKADGTAWGSCDCGGTGASGSTGGYGASGNAGGHGATGNAGGWGAYGAGGAVGGSTNVGGSAGATTWDVVSDFSTTVNPNGPYAYGWVPSLGGVFSMHDLVTPGTAGCVNNIVDWHSSALLPSQAPVVGKNITNTTCNDIPPGAVNLHPGPNGEYSVLRWTSSVAGTISIDGYFGAGDSSPMSYFIYKDGATELYHLYDANGDGPFSIVENVSVGTTIDFLTGEYYVSGGTPLYAAITLVN